MLNLDIFIDSKFNFFYINYWKSLSTIILDIINSNYEKLN